MFSVQGVSLQVYGSLVHVPVGGDLSLKCYANGTGISSRQISWKFEDHWLHNRTIHPDNTTIELVVKNVSLHNSGIYTCSVINSSKYNILDQNVTVVIGGKYRLLPFSNFYIDILIKTVHC